LLALAREVLGRVPAREDDVRDRGSPVDRIAPRAEIDRWRETDRGHDDHLRAELLERRAPDLVVAFRSRQNDRACAKKRVAGRAHDLTPASLREAERLPRGEASSRALRRGFAHLWSRPTGCRERARDH